MISYLNSGQENQAMGAPLCVPWVQMGRTKAIKSQENVCNNTRNISFWGDKKK